MALFIDSVSQIDRDLANAVAPTFEATARLDAIEAASLKALIQSIVRWVEGDALLITPTSNVGGFITRARERILVYVSGHGTVEGPQEITVLQNELGAIARENGVDQFVTYTPLQAKDLLQGMSRLGEATIALADKDVVEYESERVKLRMDHKFSIAPERIEELITARTEEATFTESLIVKKPDYLGLSMWELRHGGKTIEASIDDREWLTRFQERRVDLKPGDAIRAVVHVIIRYGLDGRVVSERYNVIKVIGAERGGESNPLLPFEGAA